MGKKRPQAVLRRKNKCDENNVLSGELFRSIRGLCRSQTLWFNEVARVTHTHTHTERERERGGGRSKREKERSRMQIGQHLSLSLSPSNARAIAQNTGVCKRKARNLAGLRPARVLQSHFRVRLLLLLLFLFSSWFCLSSLALYFSRGLFARGTPGSFPRSGVTILSFLVKAKLGSALCAGSDQRAPAAAQDASEGLWRQRMRDLHGKRSEGKKVQRGIHAYNNCPSRMPREVSLNYE